MLAFAIFLVLLAFVTAVLCVASAFIENQLSGIIQVITGTVLVILTGVFVIAASLFHAERFDFLFPEDRNSWLTVAVVTLPLIWCLMVASIMKVLMRRKTV